MNIQKQLTILIVIAVSLVSFLGGYLLTQPHSSMNAVVQEQRGNLIDRFDGVATSSTPTPLPPGLFQASSDTVLAAVAAQDGEAALYYHTGGVSRVDLESRKTQTISQVAIPGLSNVIWSPDKNRVITLARTSKGPGYAYFDYTTREHGTLGPNIISAVFSPDSRQIASARNPGGDNGAIETSDFNGQNPRTVLKTRLSNIKLYWPRSDLLAFSAADSDGATESLYTLSLNGDLAQILSGVDRLSVRWALDGHAFIYSKQGADGFSLSLFDIKSQQSILLSIATGAQTCAWSIDNVHVMCATQTAGRTSIVLINTDDQKTTTLFSHFIVTPQEVFLSGLEKFLVIISAADHSLWAVKLP